MIREIEEITTGRPASDGDGVKLIRVFGGGHRPDRFDPFLLLDAFGSDEASDYIGGFPSHPHRGFETVTYMLEGRMLHEDHLGNRGLLQNGDVQWMTAARGIIHSEMPQQEEGRMNGFQLWVNLPAVEKMKDPFYRDIPAAEIPVREVDGVYYKVIAGELALGEETIQGAVVGLSTNPTYLDIHFSGEQEVNIPIADGHTLVAYVYQGSLSGGKEKRPIGQGQLALFSRNGNLQLKGTDGARVLILAGKPLNEPVVQYGPFVMNTPQEIDQAIQDYRDGTLTR